MPERVRRRGAVAHRVRPHERGARPEPDRPLRLQLPGAGRREHGDPHRARHRASRRSACSRPLVRGEIRSCFTMTEPEFAGSNPVWMGTTARKEGGEWVLRGHKWFASSADGAAFAVCMAVTNPGRQGSLPARQHDPRPDRHARASSWSATSRSWGTAARDWASHGEVSYQGARVPLAQPARAARGAGSSSRSSGSAPGASTTACAGSASASGPSTSSAEHAATRELAPGKPLGTQADGPAVDRREPRRDRRGAADGAARRLEDRAGGGPRGARGDLAHQVHRGAHAAARARPRHPGARRRWG